MKTVGQSVARQQCRAWIETPHAAAPHPEAECVARQQCRAWIETTVGDLMLADGKVSPDSNVGRGLKLGGCDEHVFLLGCRPTAMSGVD